MVYGVDVIPERQIKKAYARYWNKKNNIPFLARCSYIHPMNNTDLDFSVIEMSLRDRNTNYATLVLKLNKERLRYEMIVRLSDIMNFFGDTIVKTDYDKI